MQPNYTVTTDSISVVWNGETHVVRKGTANFAKLREALMAEDWDKVPGYLTIKKSISTWSSGLFKMDGEQIKYKKDKVLPDDLSNRIIEMVTEGADPSHLLKFWEKLSLNPSFRSVNQLFGFLQHSNIPIDKDGCLLCYKSVKGDYKDVHSGRFDNRPGVTNSMPRNEISDDPHVACHEGFHVGALAYAERFGGSRIVVCKVDPQDVVCVPFDSSQQKVRVCKYSVIGNYGAKLSSTNFTDDLPPLETTKEVRAVKGKKTKSKTTKVKGAKPPTKEFLDLDKVPYIDLIEQPLAVLRKYATNHLKIVGGGSLPGGKAELLKAIKKVRK